MFGSFLLTNGPFLAYSGKALLRSTVMDCKQRSSTVSNKAPTVSKKASPLKKSCVRKLKKAVALSGVCAGVLQESSGKTPGKLPEFFPNHEML